MLDYVYDILEISVNIKLKFDDFQGNNVLLGGNISNGTHINVTRAKGQHTSLAIDESKLDHTLYELVDS